MCCTYIYTHVISVSILCTFLPAYVRILYMHMYIISVCEHFSICEHFSQRNIMYSTVSLVPSQFLITL